MKHKSAMEKAHWKVRGTVHKFNDPHNVIFRLGRVGTPISEIIRLAKTGQLPPGTEFLGVKQFQKNCLLNEGINELWTLACGTGATKFDNGNAYIGVGDTATPAADPAQTGLQAPTNKKYNAMDGGYPTYGSSQKATWRATFAAADANFAWAEWTIANGNSDSAKNLNRKVQALGTKASPASWIFTVDVTLA